MSTTKCVKQKDYLFVLDTPLVAFSLAKAIDKTYIKGATKEHNDMTYTTRIVYKDSDTERAITVVEGAEARTALDTLVDIHGSEGICEMILNGAMEVCEHDNVEIIVLYVC